MRVMRLGVNENVKNRARKSKNYVATETYRDFCENTSIHGLKYTMKDEIVSFEKIFWIFVVILGLGCAAYMTVLFWQRYTSNPTRTAILTDYASTSNIYFPAITVCNIYRILGHKIDQFVSKLDVPLQDEDTFKKILFKLTGFTTPLDDTYNETELILTQKILEKNDITDMVYLMKKITQNCDDLFLSCAWNKKSTPCSHIFKESITTDGVCCSFNYFPPNSKGDPLTTRFSGLGSGLRAIIQPSPQDKNYSKNDVYMPGVKVAIHGPFDYPGPESISKLTSIGRAMFLQIIGTDIQCSESVKILSVEHRKCVYPNEYKLRYFERYVHTNCVNECEALHYYKACGCVPFYYNFADKPICNITRLPCIQAAKSGDLLINNCENCPAPCEDTFYNIISSSTSITYNDTKDTLYSLYGLNVSHDKILLNAYFWSNRQTILKRDTITSTLYLLSSFGGVYSLFLGCSVITMIEIAYYVLLRLVVSSKFFSKKDEDPKHNLAFVGDVHSQFYPPNKHLN